MKSSNERIFALLVNDETLTDMLGVNAPFYNPEGIVSRKNSIVPADMVNRKMAMPVVGIQEGTETKIGHELKDESFFIRCYNDVSKSYIRINEILDRIRELLDGSELTLSDRVFVDISFEARMPGLVDEEIGLKFKEERYRLTVL